MPLMFWRGTPQPGEGQGVPCRLTRRLSPSTVCTLGVCKDSANDDFLTQLHPTASTGAWRHCPLQICHGTNPWTNGDEVLLPSCVPCLAQGISSSTTRVPLTLPHQGSSTCCQGDLGTGHTVLHAPVGTVEGTVGALMHSWAAAMWQ